MEVGFSREGETHYLRHIRIRTPADVAQDSVTAAVMSHLRDSIIAIKLLKEEHGRPIEALTNQLHDIDTVENPAGK